MMSLAPLPGLFVRETNSARSSEIASTGGTREVLAHDVLLLCTDGLWGYVDDASMIDSLAHATSSADWLNRMATQVRDTAPPGNDNFTALAIWVGGL